MYIVTDPSYYRHLMDKYKSIYVDLRGSKSVLLVTDFHLSFQKWLKDEYRCENFGTEELYFVSEKDFIWFKLRV